MQVQDSTAQIYSALDGNSGLLVFVVERLRFPFSIAIKPHMRSASYSNLKGIIRSPCLRKATRLFEDGPKMMENECQTGVCLYRLTFTELGSMLLR
jgi:hypothetical protein